MLLYKRMTAFLDIDNAWCIHNRTAGVHISCQLSLCKYTVQSDKYFVVREDFICMFWRHGAKFCKNHFNFSGFLKLKFTYIIIQLNNGCRFNEKCRAGRRLVMYHSRECGLVFCLNRKTVPSLSCGNYIILKISPVWRRIKHLVKFTMNSVIGNSFTSSYTS